MNQSKLETSTLFFKLSEVKSAGKKAAGSEFWICFLLVKRLPWSQRTVQEFLKYPIV